MHDLFATLCFQYRMVSVEYFMDSMQEWEISEVCDCIPDLDRGLWEMTRLMMYQNIQINSKKPIAVEDVLRFKWDKEDNSLEQEIQTVDIERLKEGANNVFQCIKDIK